MSVPFGPNILTFSDVVGQLRTAFAAFADRRRGKNIRYSLVDAGLSAFSVFFMQFPSFLEYQRTMQKTQGNNNAQTLFGVHQIPTDNHIRHLLDGVEPSAAYPMFSFVFDGLRQAGVVDSLRAVGGTLLIAFDGVEYFSSHTISCPQCSTRLLANDQTLYSHTALTPVVVSPGMDKVIPLAPEFVQPQDGQQKQDCELNAARRWLAQWAEQYAPLGVTVLGDDLYCHEPFCRALLDEGLDFILVCKPDSHQELYEWVAFLDRSGAIQTRTRKRWTGKHYEIDLYRFVTQVPLRDGEEALTVNWCELTTTVGDKVIYHNAFATSHPVTADNVIELISAGRSRWKIENENNNTLKTKGYHFAHNYGHGKQHLSALLATLILLAYLLHTLLEWMDDKYCLLRQKLPSRQRLFNDLRALTTYLCFKSWDDLLDFMLRGWSSPVPKLDTG
jgi:hypothetical protein